MDPTRKWNFTINLSAVNFDNLNVALYSGLGGSSNSGGVESVPHLNASSTEYRRQASKYKDAQATLNNENNT